MVDRTLLLRKLSELDEYLGQIKDYSGLSVEGYVADWKTQRIVRLIDENLSPIMADMAKFRNILVHQYDGVDATIVVGILRKHLDDFLLFRDAILKIL